jgi:hypothetical protein
MFYLFLKVFNGFYLRELRHFFSSFGLGKGLNVDAGASPVMFTLTIRAALGSTGLSLDHLDRCPDKPI